jgi:L-lactate dehydrogenase complex protein LldE
MLADKITNAFHRSGALLGGDRPAMHINGGLSRSQTRTRTVHLAAILASTKENPA